MPRFLDRSHVKWGPCRIKADIRTFNLADYLSPGEKYPYDDLIPDLEATIADDWKVHLYSVPGFLILTGSADWGDLKWSNGRGEYFATAKEAMES